MAGQDPDALERISVGQVDRLAVDSAAVHSSLGKLFLQFFEMYANCGRWGDGHSVYLADGRLLQEVQCPLTNLNIEAQLLKQQWQRWIIPEFARAVALFNEARERMTVAVSSSSGGGGGTDSELVAVEEAGELSR